MSEVFEATRERRQYSRWVADETIEDFALRFTARRARRWSMGRVANSAIGSISFLALEAIGAAITLTWGFDTALRAILISSLILFITGFPIAYYAARYGVDIDLLTRGAGFGYLGSTLTSLIYALFTFIFFAIEAAILATALRLALGIPVSIGYLIAALAVLPLVTRGFATISAFQALTQPIWIALHILPFALLALAGYGISDWTQFAGTVTPEKMAGFHIPELFAIGAASGIILALIAQIGEQVDILRFLPEPTNRGEKIRWWMAVIAAGPGWALIGVVKLLLGSWLITLVPLEEIGHGFSHAIDPTLLYHTAFTLAVPEAWLALLLTTVFVVLSQLKINVTNAYAGSIAWSNFFSRITHAHPGRVVWLVFNVGISLLLMELGVFGAIKVTLSLYSHVALAWIGALFADLTINKPLGLSPKGIEFRRAHLYDINPVGIGAMAGGTIFGILATSRLLGPEIAALSPFIALFSSIALAPVLAYATRGRYYIARPAPQFATEQVECCLCEYSFDPEDMAQCPYYGAPICSLCCSLNASCGDACKAHATLANMIDTQIERRLPQRVVDLLRQRLTRFAALTALLISTSAGVLLLIRKAADSVNPMSLDGVLALLFACSVVVIGVAVWLFLLTREARLSALRDSEVQTARLFREIRAHDRTEAALQDAKDKAEAASLAKTRYMTGLSHELRTPLNAIYGYAQILDADPDIPANRAEPIRTIRRASEHLAGLIEELLDISKIEAGRLDLNRTRVHFPGLLRQITDIFQETARHDKLSFTVTRTTSLPEWVVVDEKRLRQIVINLLANAFRYTQQGGVSLRIGWRNHVATIEVEDTGIGIPAHDLARIWNPFERGSGHLPHGTGLGLTITRLLVDILGGDITVESTPGVGSTFRLKLYLAQAAVDPDMAAIDLPAPTVAGHYDGRRRLVMIVDDDPDHLSMMQAYLRPNGFNTVTAASAEAAQQMLTEIEPDLFLLDVDLPQQNGWQLLEHLRLTDHAKTPVIMLSGHALEGQSGAPDIPLHDAFIAKPFILYDLLAKMDVLLRLTRRAPENPPAPLATIDPDAIKTLRDAARIGHLRGLRDVLATMQGPEETLRALHEAALQADFDAILQILDEE